MRVNAYLAIPQYTPPQKTTATTANTATDADADSSNSTNKAAQIMHKYNLHDISYAEVTTMMMELLDALGGR